MKNVSQELLDDITAIILQLKDEDYGLGLSVLNGNSIGKHIRHILDLYECLTDCADTGILNYDNRKRNLTTETHREFAIEKIKNIGQKVKNSDLKRELILKQKLSGLYCEIKSSMERELLYNIEHSIHHLAIIRIGIENNFHYVEIPENFGIAHSTVSHREKSDG